MNEPLDASVTLEEVFSVVGSKRVPLAPELAGYLALDIAENLGDAAGPVDAARVYIGEEGTVAVVKPRQAAPGTPRRPCASSSPSSSRPAARRPLPWPRSRRRPPALGSRRSSKSWRPPSSPSTAPPVDAPSRGSRVR